MIVVVRQNRSFSNKRSVFDRYNIVTEDDLAYAAVKIEAGKTGKQVENGQNPIEMHHNREAKNTS